MDVSQKLLQLLARVDSITSADAATSLKIDHQTVVGGINSLLQSEGLIEADPVVQTEFTLTDEGQHVLTHGSHEFVVYSSVPEDGIAMTELMKVSPYAKVGVSKALASKWIRVTKTPENTQIVTKACDSVVDEVKASLENLQSCGAKEKSELKKRKLITEKKVTIYKLKKGKLFSTSRSKEETDLTSEMILTGSWQECKFKKYNFNALGVPQPMGHLHPLLRVRAEFRRILMDMGFSEMPTNNYVESSFWNFDTLFQPQHHPARDAHDTFFLSDPATTDVKTHCPTDYLNRVKTVHETGGFGSTGYRYNWQLSEAEKKYPAHSHNGRYFAHALPSRTTETVYPSSVLQHRSGLPQ
uniref:Phenylalanine--tRNA ligase alpha subunit B n=1 Tax=Schistocephalus solidus TaxID=70667 RepID=A0A0V0J6T7_SCHSO